MNPLRFYGRTTAGSTIYAYAPVWARTMAKRLREQGYSVTVDPPHWPGVMLVRLPTPRMEVL